MSGRPYTLKEMKGIVEYITENKYYSEIKGRKMWMDYANTSLTNRTWQSLKETLLKRILPDIYNPYYKLSKEQVISFKQGYDIEAKNRNKLDIQTISDSSSDGQQQKDKQSTTSAVIEQDVENESLKISCRNRSSTDTVVLENCYENAEEIQKVLESPCSPCPIDKKQKKATKKNKELITASPFPPILQRVINDFASESDGSDREPVMEIDLNAPDAHGDDDTNQKPETTMNQHNKEDVPNVANTPKEVTINVDDEVESNENLECGVRPTEKISENKSENDDSNKIKVVNDVDTISEDIIKSKDNAVDNCQSNLIFNLNSESGINDDSTVVNKKSLSPSCSNMTDSLLPNNPEELKIKKITQVEGNINEDNAKDNKKNLRSLRKRATSEDNLLVENKKQRLLTKMTEKENKTIENTEDISKSCLENIVENVEEVVVETNFNKSTTTVIESAQKEKHDSESPQMENLCLKSVSLYEEQLNGKKYSDSESSVNNLKSKNVKAKPEVINVQTKVSNDNVILLKSNTESESGDVVEINKSSVVNKIAKSRRDDALAKVFGFSTGAVTSKRKRKLNQKGSISRHKTINTIDSDSSEWTSQTDSETYVSPPRGRRNRHMRKYLKPKSAPILSLEEEGGLFVMYGKRIYPIVRDGKIVKNYLTYTPESDSDFVDESFWKLKYEEEKKKSEELKNMLNQNQEQNVSRDRRTSLKQETNYCGKQTAGNCQTEPITPVMNNNNNFIKGENEACVETKTEEKIKIKFTRNNEEVHLEGHWPQIHPVLEQVVNIFHKDPIQKIDEPKTRPSLDSPVPKEIVSGKTTPLIMTVDPEVREKVDSLEKKIFQEIEERDKEEQTEPEEQEKSVKKRSLRLSRKGSSTPVHSVAKKSKPSKQKEPTKPDDSILEETLQQEANQKTGNKTEKPANTTYVIKTRTRARKTDASFEELTEKNPKGERKSTTSKNEESKTLNDGLDDESVRYMLPPRNRRSLTRNLNSKNTQNTGASYLTEPADITSPDSLSRISESTQGYHESDSSPVRLKKKKNLSRIVRPSKRSCCHSLLRSQRNRFLNIPHNSSKFSLSRSKTHNSEQSFGAIHYSESNQCSFPHRVRSSNILERIDETCAIENDDRLLRFKTPSNEEHNIKSHVNDAGSSSNVSLPPSPELSLVENISISKEQLNNINTQHIINDTQANNDKGKQSHVNYLISEMDITLPLMHQTIEKDVVKDKDRSSNKTNRTTVTESLLKEIRDVKIYDNSSDSIDRKLQDLLLESTKPKRSMEVDVVTNNTRKSGPKKRCSTPRKKREAKKSKTSKVDVIMEEHTECCAVVGGSSCPPSIQVFDDNAMDCEQINPNNKSDVKRKQKKNIIKVKILKPKPNKSKDRCEIFLEDDNRMSVCTDSCINDTEMTIIPINCDNSVELIHNHSETCLQANECIGDSVEFIENNSSVVSLDSSSVRSVDCQTFIDKEFLSIENDWQLNNNNNNNDVQNYQLFNIQLKSNLKNGSEMIRQIPTTSEFNSSLITEDLSDETPTPSQPTKWYLFSEDEISNTNNLCSQKTGAGTGANLKQIFPITCAIPNLSDITEASKEHDDSKKLRMNVDFHSLNSI